METKLVVKADGFKTQQNPVFTTTGLYKLNCFPVNPLVHLILITSQYVKSLWAFISPHIPANMGSDNCPECLWRSRHLKADCSHIFQFPSFTSRWRHTRNVCTQPLSTHFHRGVASFCSSVGSPMGVDNSLDPEELVSNSLSHVWSEPWFTPEHQRMNVELGDVLGSTGWLDWLFTHTHLYQCEESVAIPSAALLFTSFCVLIMLYHQCFYSYLC